MAHEMGSKRREALREMPGYPLNESEQWNTYAVLGQFLNELRLLVLSKLVSFHFIHFA